MRVAAIAMASAGVVLTASTLFFGGLSFITQAVANGLGVAIGLVIVVRGSSRDARRMGWLVAIAMLGIQIGTHAVLSDWLLERGHTDAAVWAATLLGSADSDFGMGIITALTLAPIGLLAVCFPDGHLPAGWSCYKWAITVVIGALAFSAALSPLHIGAVRFEHPLFESAVAETWTTLAEIILLAMALLLLGSLASLVARYRSPATTTVARQQIKWFGFGLGLYVVTVTSLLILEAFVFVSTETFVVIDGLAFTAIPLSLGVAILRFRLYDIDRLISRTLAYALTFALLTGVFVAIATSPVLFAGSEAESFPPLLVSISTLVVAALFNPLRRRLLRSLERRFDRAHYDAELVIEDFGDRVNDLTDRAAIEAGLADVLARTLAPTTVGIWIADRTS